MRVALSVAALLTLACVAAPLTKHGIDVVGTAADRRQLAGNWRGTFETPDHTHDGTIQFDIDSSGSSGDGSVLLTDQNARLRVIYVRISGADIAGAIEPYFDKVCDCTVYSTFNGRLEPPAIRGEFVMKPRLGPPIVGSWSVKR